MRKLARMFAVALVSVTSVICACTAQNERVGSSAAAILNGATDTEDTWRNAGVLVGGCTGTLITPVHVITANHCITGAATGLTQGPGWGMNTAVQVKFGATPGSSWNGSAARVINTSTYAVQETNAITPPDPHDIAVVTLQASPLFGTGAGNWNVTPIHPWEANITCPSSYTGTELGDGWNSVAGDGSFNGTWDGVRHINSSESISCSSSFCNASFSSNYLGGLPGDSGGPLLFSTGQSPPFLVCGAFHTFPWPLPGTSVFVQTYQNTNDSFIKNIAWDFKRNAWYGTNCGPDSDNDVTPESWPTDYVSAYGGTYGEEEQVFGS